MKTAFEIVLEIWKLPPPPISLPANYVRVRAKDPACEEGKRLQMEDVDNFATSKPMQYPQHLANCETCRTLEGMYGRF